MNECRSHRISANCGGAWSIFTQSGTRVFWQLGSAVSLRRRLGPLTSLGEERTQRGTMKGGKPHWDSDLAIPAIAALLTFLVIVASLYLLKRRGYFSRAAGMQYVTNADGQTVRRSTRRVAQVLTLAWI